MRSGTKNSVGSDGRRLDLVSSLLALAPYTELEWSTSVLPLIMGKVAKKGTSALYFQYNGLSLVMTSKQWH